MTEDPAITKENVENQVKGDPNFCRIDSVWQNKPNDYDEICHLRKLG
jgi:hypothetical protein